jgi:hypothetical protein
MGLNYTWVKGFLARLRQYRQHEGFCPRSQLKILAYNLSFPTSLPCPRKCAPYFLKIPSAAPLLFKGFKNMSDKKSQSTIVAAGIPQEITFPSIL